MSLDLSNVWLDALRTTLISGMDASPRGMRTKELLHFTHTIDMRRPVLYVPSRKFSYKFMSAEAYWILSGDNTVKGIEQFNKNIAAFSDDGETFFGAYGPKIKGQLGYVVKTLIKDPDTRQAGLTIWRESPPQTKDVPCTVSIFFSRRNDKLNAHVFMRSSDVWLGLPYDAFNFSMLAHLVCAHINSRTWDSVRHGSYTRVTPGDLYLTAASSHLYEKNWKEAEACAELNDWQVQHHTPGVLYEDPGSLMLWLDELRFTKPGDTQRWWESRA